MKPPRFKRQAASPQLRPPSFSSISKEEQGLGLPQFGREGRGSDPACMNRSDTTLTKPVVMLIAFAQFHSLCSSIIT
ncbi:hypothetical protein ACE6H2_003774 [Prunus campanulata]